jgi:hypothetical protein
VEDQRRLKSTVSQENSTIELRQMDKLELPHFAAFHLMAVRTVWPEA